MSLVFKNALMPSESQQVLRLRLGYFMRRLFFFLLIAITIFVQPFSTFAADANLTPAQYKMAKIWSSRFCEARADGLSVQSSYGNEQDGYFWNFLRTGGVLEMLKLEKQEETDGYAEKMFAYALSKVQKDCPFPELDLSAFPEDSPSA